MGFGRGRSSRKIVMNSWSSSSVVEQQQTVVNWYRSWFFALGWSAEYLATGSNLLGFVVLKSRCLLQGKEEDFANWHLGRRRDRTGSIRRGLKFEGKMFIWLRSLEKESFREGSAKFLKCLFFDRWDVYRPGQMNLILIHATGGISVYLGRIPGQARNWRRVL